MYLFLDFVLTFAVLNQQNVHQKKQTCYLPTGLNVTAGETRQVTTSDDVSNGGGGKG